MIVGKSALGSLDTAALPNFAHVCNALPGTFSILWLLFWSFLFSNSICFEILSVIVTFFHFLLMFSKACCLGFDPLVKWVLLYHNMLFHKISLSMSFKEKFFERFQWGEFNRHCLNNLRNAPFRWALQVYLDHLVSVINEQKVQSSACSWSSSF